MRTILAQASSSVSAGLSEAASSAGYVENVPVTTLAANIIEAVLGIMGIVFVGLTVYAGILYITAAGNEENVKKAKRLLTNSVIGLVVILSAYAISRYVFQALYRIVNAQ